MRIVNREQFLAMPEGVLFCKYEPCVFDELQIKSETWASDFLCQQLLSVKADSPEEPADVLNFALLDGTSFDLDLDCSGRDGCFDKEQLFCVFEEKDLAALIGKLEGCVAP